VILLFGALELNNSFKSFMAKKNKGALIDSSNLLKRLAEIERREGSLEERERFLQEKEARLEKKEKEIEKQRKSWEEKISSLAGLTPQKAKELLLKNLESELKEEVAKRIARAEEEIKLNAEERAREILVEAMRHGVTDVVAEYTVSSVKIPSEEIKGKIIGREGRNIRAFERATGVEVDLEEEGEVRLSSFDFMRRAIAKRALEKLIKDGRIQPSRIEEVVAETKREIDRIVLEEGKRICQEVGAYNLPLDLVKILGRFRYRFSFGQNMIVHTLEETKIGMAIARELKADVDTVRLGCLFHDIGKVVYSKKGGSHIQLGVELLEKYHLPKEVINCVAEHHEDRPFSSVESAIVWLADAISGSRPGARYEAHEDYLKRMTRIEEMARSFPGVADVAAYQAGREVRIIVKPEEISDDEAKILAHKLAKKLEEDARWLGQMKITVIRETRSEAVSPPEEERG